MSDWKKVKTKREGFRMVYDSSEIRALNALYNIVLSEMGAGKSYDGCEEILNDYLKSPHRDVRGCIIRRYRDDVDESAGNYWDGLIDNDVLKGTGFDGIVYASQKKKAGWYLFKYDEDLDKNILEPEPFCYAFALNTVEKYRGGHYESIKTIIWDEIITTDGTGYLPNEYAKFKMILKRIMRDQRYVENGRSLRKVWLYGNTTSYVCPVLKDFGIRDLRDYKQGTITVFNGDKKDHTKKNSINYVALQLLNPKPQTDDENNAIIDTNAVFFEFSGNGIEQSILTGSWGFDMDYAHLPDEYYETYKDNIVYTYYIADELSDHLYRCDICDIRVNDTQALFTYVHSDEDSIEPDSIVFSLMSNPESNFRRFINKPYDKLGKFIWTFFGTDKVYYEDNYAGQDVKNYLVKCNKITPYQTY